MTNPHTPAPTPETRATAWIIPTPYGHLGPFLSRFLAYGAMRPSDTLVEARGYVIGRTADAETDYHGPYPDIAAALAALADLAAADTETYGPDWATYGLSHH